MRHVIPAAAAALLSLSPLTAPLRAQDLLVTAGTVVIARDTVLTPGEFLVRGGKIAFVGNEIPADARARARVVDFPGATIVPGFVLPHSWLGQDPDLVERAAPFTPDLPTAEAFDPFGEELAKLPANAVTSAALAPSSRNVAGGIAALVKPGRDQGSLAADSLYAMLSLAAQSRDPERPPTSLMGAVDLLRSQFALARNTAQSSGELTILRQILAGSRRCAIHADSWAELDAALDLATEFAFEPVLVGAADAGRLLPRLQAAKAKVILGTLSPDARLQQLQLPGELERAGIPVAFASSRPATLRLTAALAVRHGMTRLAALAALTRTPAQLIDQADRIGSLRAGADADFAVFAGDPLDLTAALRAVYVDGQRLFETTATTGSKP